MEQQLARDEDITRLIEQLQDPNTKDIATIDDLLQAYPQDPRLHFMRGSVLAEKSDAMEAHAAIKRAVELAPDFVIARYQLGFFELTSGEADKALSTWGPILAMPEDNYLRVFVEGMIYLIRDEFEAAVDSFERGLKLNSENEPLNNDIRLLIDKTKDLTNTLHDRRDADGDDDLSATSLILGHFGGNRTIN